MDNKPFGCVDVGAEVAAAMGMDPRPYLSAEQVAQQLAVSGMTAEEWNAAWDAKLARTDDVPF
jgi:hypothetical protein